MKLNLKNKKNNHTHTHDHTHSHDHDHNHDHGHNHEHDNKNEHSHSQPQGEMGVAEKIKLLCSHWVSHNDSHAGTYGEWADKAKAEGLKTTSELLKEISDMTIKISEKIRDAEKSVK